MKTGEFLVYVNKRGNDFYLFIYDREIVLNEKSKFHGMKFNLSCSADELNELLGKSTSINFFGEKSVKKGVEEGYIHPESITEINGVPCAIFIKM